MRVRPLSEMAHPVHIGCSGWVCREWRGTFYPDGCAQSRWLQHYAGRFETVELNTTFYRRGRRGNYSEAELHEWAARISGWRREVEVYAYFNNDWETFAPRNALRLRELLGPG